MTVGTFTPDRRTVGIPEYDDNPFIACLPAPFTDEEMFKHLAVIPCHRGAELKLEPHLREQLIFIRCRKLFVPTSQQRRHAAQVDLLIRAGYCARNPTNGAFVRSLTALDGSGAALIGNSTTADSMAVLGPSGIGKTTTLIRTLAAYDQVITHHSPAFIRQIVWLLLDCPSGGSPKQLCIAFFQEVDRLLGTRYYEKFGALSTDHMLGRVRHVASLHAIGLLAIDEIQNLAHASVGQEQVLAFLTSLVNVASIPVLLIGTMRAYDVLTKNFRIARRGEGLGSIVYDPLEPGREWDDFTRTLFRFQWTATSTEWTPDLSQVFWEESQGIIDIVVKLFMLSQMRAIRHAQRAGGDEILSAGLVKQVAHDSLKLVKPMLEALRRRDWVALAVYDDLASLDMCIAKSLALSWGIDGCQPDLDSLLSRVEAIVGEGSGRSDVTAALTASGLTPEQVRHVLAQIDEVRRQGGSHGDRSQINPVSAPSSKRGKKVAPRSSTSRNIQPVMGDIREIATGASDPATALAKAGYIPSERG